MNLDYMGPWQRKNEREREMEGERRERDYDLCWTGNYSGKAAQGPSRGASLFLKRGTMLLLLDAWSPSCHLIPGGCLLEDQGRRKEWPH